MSVIGFDGLPQTETAGNVLYKELKCKVSLRLPPTLDAKKAAEIVREKMSYKSDDLFNAIVDFELIDAANGLDAPKLPEDIEKKFFSAHKTVFGGNDPISIGCGGSIPFMEVFAQNFPGTNFLLTGVGFGDSNAHSANENIDIEYTERLVQVVALTIAQL